MKISPNNPEWTCIDQEEAPIPLWMGGKFNFVKGVESGYVVLKARLGQLMDMDGNFSTFYRFSGVFKAGSTTDSIQPTTLSGRTPTTGRVTTPTLHHSLSSFSVPLMSPSVVLPTKKVQ